MRQEFAWSWEDPKYSRALEHLVVFAHWAKPEVQISLFIKTDFLPCWNALVAEGKEFPFPGREAQLYQKPGPTANLIEVFPVLNIFHWYMNAVSYWVEFFQIKTQLRSSAVTKKTRLNIPLNL